jgi:hypothetical protein
MAGAIEFSSVMLAALNCCCDRRERQHICGPGRVARGERGPIVHHLLAQFKERRAPIGRDHGIGHGMGKRCLGDSILVSAVGGPIPERRPEAVRGDVVALHAAQQDQQSHIAQRAATGLSEENVVSAVGDLAHAFQHGNRRRAQRYLMLPRSTLELVADMRASVAETVVMLRERTQR